MPLARSRASGKLPIGYREIRHLLKSKTPFFILHSSFAHSLRPSVARPFSYPSIILLPKSGKQGAQRASCLASPRKARVGTLEAWHSTALGCQPCQPQVIGSHRKTEPRRGDTRRNVFQHDSIPVAPPGLRTGNRKRLEANDICQLNPHYTLHPCKKICVSPRSPMS